MFIKGSRRRNLKVQRNKNLPMHYFTATAIDAALLAGKHLFCKYKSHEIEIGENNTHSVSNRGLTKEITSIVDHQADRLIIDLISSRHPSHSLLTEETGYIDNESDYCWVVDPLDGSSNFVNHNPFFAVSICLAFQDVPITGVIYAPFLDEIAVARKGQGFTLNGRSSHVSPTHHLEKSYIVGCPGGDKTNDRFSTMSYFINRQVKDFRKMGSAAIEAYTVAAGRVDAFVTLNIPPWDVAAGALCVAEAGGVVTDFNGNPWTLRTTDLCMSNGLFHNQILSTLGSVNSNLQAAGSLVSSLHSL